MKSTPKYLPAIVIAVVSAGALWHGPIAQLPRYHDFADQSIKLGVPHFADVLSNLGFALVALLGWLQIGQTRRYIQIKHGWAGYQLFLIGLFLTAFGSGYYHLVPDNARLVWDRLPIALACAGLLAGVWGDVHARNSRYVASGLAVVAAMSVAWWYFTELAGSGDLRPYLLLQVAPLLLIPLWQRVYESPRADQRAFGMALLLYIAAKFAELYDHEIGSAVGLMTGHTLKHLLATGAAAVVVARLADRVRSSGAVTPVCAYQ